MSVLPKLATSLNRRDEVPNQELAAQIVHRADLAGVAELIEHLADKNKGIRHDCIKVLYEIGYKEPKLISNALGKFLDLLNSKDNRMQWGAMTAVGCIANDRPGDVFDKLPEIIDAADKGSVITRDQCVNILTKLCASAKYVDSTFPLLLEQLMTCPTNQLAMYAENAVPIVSAALRERFTHILSVRLNDLEKESLRKRIEKVIRKVGK